VLAREPAVDRDACSGCRRGGTAGRRLADRLDEIAKHCPALPVVRERSADEILGYDEWGLTRSG
jgi:hypothetical protein